MALLPRELHMANVATDAGRKEYIESAPPVREVDAPPITVDTACVQEMVAPMISTEQPPSPEEQQPSEHEQEVEPETVSEPAPKRQYQKVSDRDIEYLKRKLIQFPNQSAAFYANITGIPLHNC